MRIINFFQINDWKIRNFLLIILSFQFLFLGIVGLRAIGIDIPILRQIISFIYLLFVPGLLILRILRFHELGKLKTILFTMGLSITFLYLLGFFINLLYPFLGIHSPISF